MPAQYLIGIFLIVTICLKIESPRKLGWTVCAVRSAALMLLMAIGSQLPPMP